MKQLLLHNNKWYHGEFQEKPREDLKDSPENRAQRENYAYALSLAIEQAVEVDESEYNFLRASAVMTMGDRGETWNGPVEDHPYPVPEGYEVGTKTEVKNPVFNHGDVWEEVQPGFENIKGLEYREKKPKF